MSREAHITIGQTMQQIYNNTNYYVTIGTSEENNNPHYLVINKKYEITEAESTILPQAIKYASDLDAALTALLDMSDKPKIQSIKKAH